ncbi:MAG TPA: twin-arginine translocase TatA/TatE family subunit [Jiangellales bacterium]|nr:twin-arginine translocase TatA/TatE family subunit [Jiangellales bacterium]
MFGLGLGEIAIIMVVALVVFGPDRLPEMAKQAAAFVRDMRKMVANARRDIGVSIQDLGIDEEDLRTLRQLRNPKAFVRDKVLDGVDLDELNLDEVGGRAKPATKHNGARQPNAAVPSNGDGRSHPGQTPPAQTTPPAAAQPDLLFDPDAT